MRSRLTAVALATFVIVFVGRHAGVAQAADDTPPLQARLDRLEAETVYGEDVHAIKKLQRAYSFYVDKGLWEDVADLFTDDAVANYPAGVYIGKPSIREHLYLNVGGGKMGEIGLREGRIYNHMNLQPVVHLDPGGQTAKGRWRALAMFGSLPGSATWAEGIYEMGYAKENGVWKIRTLDYYSGFGAQYETGWATDPNRPRRAGVASRNLAHPPDRVRDMTCEGFPAACIAPLHYANPGTAAGGMVWTVSTDKSAKATVDPRERAADLALRATLLRDREDIENLQRIYGYYMDRNKWSEIAALFASNGTMEVGLGGVYAGAGRIEQFLGLIGPEGGMEGQLNDRLQLQVIVDVAPDGRTARSRSRELAMTGIYQKSGAWSEGLYENRYVKENGIWKFQALHFYPTFITDYDKGWGKDAQPVPTASTTLPPDRPPTEVYEIYPKRHVPAFHYRNPVTNVETHYPPTGGPSAQILKTVLIETGKPKAPKLSGNLETTIAEAERQIERVKDYHELENLESAYGYYLDKDLWNDLSTLIAKDGSMELAQRGIYKGYDRVHGFLVNVFGRGGEGPVEGRLGNHLQLQPVIHVAPDGKTAKIRIRLWQQMSQGDRASLGAGVYENEAVKEDGVWKFRVVHTYNTFTANYKGGWVNSPGGGLPGPSPTYPPDGPPTMVFAMFPKVYLVPFHYPNPVTGRPVQ
jgi:hypothetical protein